MVFDPLAAIRDDAVRLHPDMHSYEGLPEPVSEIPNCHSHRVWTKGDRLYGDYWRFTSRSSRLLFEEVFAPGEVTVASYGNVLSAASFLYGLATTELRREELDFHDPGVPLLIGVRAQRQHER